ncbi:MAG: hypothetical protein IPN34_18485 [Planctomycetes bacterium]|nr:hypothetical protein [Planctomycetota bacterium]
MRSNQRIPALLLPLVLALGYATQSSAQEKTFLIFERGVHSRGTREVVRFDGQARVNWERSHGQPQREILASIDLGFTRRLALIDLGGAELLAVGATRNDALSARLLSCRDEGSAPTLQSLASVEAGPGVYQVLWLGNHRTLYFANAGDRSIYGISLLPQGAPASRLELPSRAFGPELASELSSIEPRWLRFDAREEGFGLSSLRGGKIASTMYVRAGATWEARGWPADPERSSEQPSWQISAASPRYEASAIKVRGADGNFVIRDLDSGREIASGHSASPDEWTVVSLPGPLPAGNRYRVEGERAAPSRPLILQARIGAPWARDPLQARHISLRALPRSEPSNRLYVVRWMEEDHAGPWISMPGSRSLALVAIVPTPAQIQTVESPMGSLLLLPDFVSSSVHPNAIHGTIRIDLPRDPHLIDGFVAAQMLLVEGFGRIALASDIAVDRLR